MEEINGTIVKNDISFIAFDVDSLLNSFEKKLETTEPNLRRDERPTIFRVPEELRAVYPAAYEPVVVALGPYNHGKPSVVETEGLKWKYLKKFLSRNSERQLKDYMMEVTKLEHRARCAYAEATKMSSEEFVEMMLLDCCFVLELLRIYYKIVIEGLSTHEYEDLRHNGEIGVTRRAILDTLIVAENQLPFFLLQALSSLNDPSFDLSHASGIVLLKFCSAILPGCDTDDVCQIGKLQKEFHHFIHMLYVLITNNIIQEEEKLGGVLPAEPLSGMQSKCSSYSCSASSKTVIKMKGCFRAMIPSLYKKSDPSLCRKSDSYRKNDPIQVPWAMKLKESGVKFKRKKDAVSILNITFHNGTMYIPQIQIFDETSHMLRNLIAFEQFFDGEDNDIANYVDLMDSLLDTAEDVDELQEDGIVINAVGSNETIALLFNEMCKGVQINGVGSSSSYLQRVRMDVVKYANKRRNRWREKLNHDYFSNPWSSISFAAATLLLILTIMQVVFAVLSYVKPPSPP